MCLPLFGPTLVPGASPYFLVAFPYRIITYHYTNLHGYNVHTSDIKLRPLSQSRFLIIPYFSHQAPRVRETSTNGTAEKNLLLLFILPTLLCRQRRRFLPADSSTPSQYRILDAYVSCYPCIFYGDSYVARRSVPCITSLHSPASHAIILLRKKTTTAKDPSCSCHAFDSERPERR